ncbi:MAG TPA: mannonate dehydratase, partial [Bryobacteraceae bacterium]|nr:mannonate dehydratase [Bryobacteraceae bacterium]
MISRRSLLASTLAIPALPLSAEQLTGRLKLTMPGGRADEAQLRFIAHLGVEWVTMGGPGAPTYTPEGRVVLGSSEPFEAPWKESELAALKRKVESFGLKIGNLMLHDFRDAILGRPNADRDIQHVQESIRVAGKIGIPIVEYNWYALRAMGGYFQERGRGGSIMAAHDYDRSRNLPMLEDVGEHNATDLWKRYERFLKAVVPVAEKAGVRLAVHPNDPPPPRYRGTDQILGSVDGLRRVCETVKSPANGITFDTGVTREMGYNVIENIQWFGKRDQINQVHFRNVVMKAPREKYTETFIDAGDNDMLACLKALHSVGYPRLIHPDHVPRHPDDPNSRGGWGYAVGQIKAMMRQL